MPSENRAVGLNAQFRFAVRLRVLQFEEIPLAFRAVVMVYVVDLPARVLRCLKRLHHRCGDLAPAHFGFGPEPSVAGAEINLARRTAVDNFDFESAFFTLRIDDAGARILKCTPNIGRISICLDGMSSVLYRAHVV